MTESLPDRNRIKNCLNGGVEGAEIPGGVALIAHLRPLKCRLDASGTARTIVRSESEVTGISSNYLIITRKYRQCPKVEEVRQGGSKSSI